MPGCPGSGSGLPRANLLLAAPVVGRGRHRAGMAGGVLDDDKVRAVLEQFADHRPPEVVGSERVNACGLTARVDIPAQ